MLLNYAWPGNVRELRLAIERAGQLGGNGSIAAEAVMEAIDLGSVAQPVVAGYSDERTLLLKMCEAQQWNAAAIAGALSISRTTLHRRLRELGLSLRRAKKYHFVPRCPEQFEPTDPVTVHGPS